MSGASTEVGPEDRRRAHVAFGALRVATAAAIFAAVIGQFAHSLPLVPSPAMFVVNFVSYFTIQSNLIGAVTLVIAAIFAFRMLRDPQWLGLLRAGATAYLATTLVVYNLLLRGIPLDQGTTLAWSNEILHLWAPLLVVVDWVFAPGRPRIAWRRLWWFAVYPVIWATYTMIRGAVVGWYPYPFLDPRISPGEGVVGVLAYVVGIAAFILLVSAGIITVSHSTRAPRR